MRVILVPVAGRPESAVALNTAFALAKKLEANVVGSHVRAHRESGPADSSGMYLALDEALSKESTPKRAEAASKAAHKLFLARARENEFELRKKPSRKTQQIAMWHELVGSPAKLMAIVGPVADLIVLTRPKNLASKKSTAFLLAAVLQAGRPVLILPDRKQPLPGKRIAIAWDQSSDAARAVSAALPLLQHAQEITIISCGYEDRTGPKPAHLARYLAHWGITAKTSHVKDANTPREMDKAFGESNADLVVMGAYTHGRLRERLFGGTTEHMLFKSKRAVLVLHS